MHRDHAMRLKTGTRERLRARKATLCQLVEQLRQPARVAVAVAVAASGGCPLGRVPTQTTSQRPPGRVWSRRNGVSARLHV